MRLIVGITGCSGVTYGTRFIKACQELEIETDLVLSPAAEKILNLEQNEELEDIRQKSTNYYGYNELGAPIASGSVKTDGMVIVPCSMKTLGSLASGIADNLITRSADVTLKEDRKLILVPRETPINYIHLKNMTTLSQAGASILPAAPGFYHDPQSIEDLIDFIVGRILDQFNIDHQLYPSWSGIEE